VNGRNAHCQILTNPAYTAYATTPTKDRQSVLAVLRNGRPPAYLWNAEAAAYLEGTGLAAGARRRLAALPEGERLDEAQLDAWLAAHLPALGPQQRRWIEDGLGLAAYHAATEHPVVELLLSDDASPFAGVARAQALCWVHEGRLFRQLAPYLPGHRRLLDDFLGQFWAYYRQLRAYREAPGPEARRDRLCQRCGACCRVMMKLQNTDSRYRVFLRQIGLTLLPLQASGMKDCCNARHDVNVDLGPCRHVRTITSPTGLRFSCEIHETSEFPSLCAEFNCVSWAKAFNSFTSDNKLLQEAMRALAESRGSRVESTQMSTQLQLAARYQPGSDDKGETEGTNRGSVP
jgi:hypothetical protein